jgi:predicted dehydrogenase/nucleoside-diphosphate-sugar epimerase
MAFNLDADGKLGVLKHGVQTVRAGMVGTGYIADFHVRGIHNIKGVELVGVCDANHRSAKAFATTWSVPAVFSTLPAMLETLELNSLHILVPPDLHYPLTKLALEAGVHVFVEKPLCTSVEQANELLALAKAKKLHLCVNHNMLYAGAYERLRNIVHSGDLGPIDHVTFNHFLELGQIRFGPFDNWMLRDPGNTILEIGPHPLSAVLDLVGIPDNISVNADRQSQLPGGAHVFRRWRVHTTIGRTTADININLGPGFIQRTISVRGLSGSALADFDANTCTIDRRTSLGIDFDRCSRSRALSNQILSQARGTISDYVFSKLKLRQRGNSYEVTFLESISAFYKELRSDKIIDKRIGGQLGGEVVKLCCRIAQAANFKTPASENIRPRGRPIRHPTVLVLGGTGFIGRELIRQLIAANYCVRAFVRSSSAILNDLDETHLEVIRGDMSNETDLKAAMDGIEFVYHLARADAKTWEDNLQRDVEPTRIVAEACLAAGIKRLIYTGTIDSYYAGARAGVITEQTPLDGNITRRNYYARAKALAEGILMDMHRARNLPVVIFRPGIVIGKGGNPFHWGVGQWISDSMCVVWGDGQNKLPFVLVTDVAAALVRGIRVDGVEGRSYNLIDAPLLTAREYLKEVQRRTGLAINVDYRPIWRFYAIDLAKWIVKLAVRHPDRVRIPSYFDWESRTQKATFDNTRARAELGWAPAFDQKRMLDEGIGGSLQSWLAASQ